jgi:hypothetical protein
MNWTDLSRVNWLTSMRGRIGFLPAWTVLLYFTGGAAWSEIDNSQVSLGIQNQSKSGWVVGAAWNGHHGQITGWSGLNI